MQTAAIVIAIVDAAGRIVGGGQTSAQGPLPYRARESFIAYASFGAITYRPGLRVLVSPVPTYSAATS
jgi:hypothetical protein